MASAHFELDKSNLKTAGALESVLVGICSRKSKKVESDPVTDVPLTMERRSVVLTATHNDSQHPAIWL